MSSVMKYIQYNKETCTKWTLDAVLTVLEETQSFMKINAHMIHFLLGDTKTSPILLSVRTSMDQYPILKLRFIIFFLIMQTRYPMESIRNLWRL